MSTVDTAEIPAPPKMTGHRVLRWVGIVCLMVAAYFAGYVVWLLWGTGLQTERAQHSLRVATDQWHGHADPTGARIVPGDAYAVLVIPSIDLDMVVVQGTEYEDLKKGPGHYIDTANPWEKTGRVGIAGHRTTYLHPFFNLDKVKPGDEITLITKFGTFTYTVDKNFVLPESTAGVVLRQTKEPTLVLTTCNPRYSSTQRLIVTADRTSGTG